MNLNLHLTGKRKQALLESNLPGISCSTGMVKRGCENQSLCYPEHSKRRMPKKNSTAVAVFILLNGPKNGGAYNCVDWAIEMLQAGHETPSLLIIAGLNKPTNHFETKDYLRKALSELKLEEKTGDSATLSYSSAL